MPHKKTKTYDKSPRTCKHDSHYAYLKGIAYEVDSSLNGEIYAIQYRVPTAIFPSGRFILGSADKEYVRFLLDCWKVKLKPDVVLKYEINKIFNSGLVITIEML